MSVQNDHLRHLITQTGGMCEGKFVTQPGCSIIAKTVLYSPMYNLLDSLNLDLSLPSYEVLGELNARLTYLSFQKDPKDSTEYREKMAKEVQHLSIFNCSSVSFLIAGISIETALEMISHKEASVGRLTTSATKAMNDPLYYLDPEVGAYQKSYLESLPTDNPSLPIEIRNSMHPGNKATVLTYTMKLKDFHSTFIGRLPEKGNERAVRQIFGMMCEQLHKEYPLVIESVESYQKKGNGEKYGLK